MIIYFILEWLSGHGGVETAVASMANTFHSQGHEAVVFLPGPSGDTKWEMNLPRMAYYHQNATSTQHGLEFVSNRAIALHRKLLEFQQPDVLIGTHVPHTTLYSRLVAGYRPDIRIVSWLHNPPETFHDPHLLNYADAHWAIAKSLAVKLTAITGNRQPVTWVGNPIECDDERVHYSDELARFIYIGRLENSQKRLDVLLKGLSLLRTEWKLDVYGDGVDEPSLRKLAIDLGLSHHIDWHGWTDKPWKLIDRATALVLTSDYEGFPMVLIEAMSRGLPVVTSDCNDGPRDLVVHERNGLLFEAGSPEKLACQLQKIATIEIDSWKAMSQYALQSVKPYAPLAVYTRMTASLHMSNLGVQNP